MATRRGFLKRVAVTALGLPATGIWAQVVPNPWAIEGKPVVDKPSHDSRLMTLFLCGDVMTGRGIDQILPHPSDPRIHEPYVKTATGYVEIAEQASGPIPQPVDFAYIWGDVLAELQRVAPDTKIINLETAVTTSDDYWKGKGINYRMHPANVHCITVAGIDCCVLANNHVLDWGYPGLKETLETLAQAGVKRAGAGHDSDAAQAPAVLEQTGKGRVLVFAFGSQTSGIPWRWGATLLKPGVNLLGELSEETVRRVAAEIRAVKRQADIVVASIHWGANWGYGVPPEQRAFAHGLIDEAGVDVVHGHSSHHPKGIEVYRDRPILYGCGDLLNDYEGIGGYEAFRGDLGLMYFLTMEPASGRLVRFQMTPTQIRRFQVHRASEEDTRWLTDVLSREGEKFETRIELSEDGTLTLRWS